MLGFVIWLFYVRLCAKLGSKRIIGGFDGAVLGICFSLIGLMIIFSSRRLNDSRADEALIKKCKPTR